MERLNNNRVEKIDDDRVFLFERARDLVEAGEEEYAELIDPFVEKFDKAAIDGIYDAFKMDNEFGYMVATEALSNALGIKESPHISFQNVEDKGNVLTPERPCHYYPKPEMLFVAKGEHQDIPLTRAIDSLAHEMWHVHQYDVIKNHGPRADLYKENLNDYVEPKQDLAGYYTQPFELEAYAFAGKILEKFFKVSVASKWRGYQDIHDEINNLKNNGGNEEEIDKLKVQEAELKEDLRQLINGEYFDRLYPQTEKAAS